MMAWLNLKNRRRNRRKLRDEGERTPFPWKRALTLAGFFAVALGAGYGVIRMLDRPIRVVAVEGRFQRVSPVQVEKAVTSDVGAGLLSANLEAVRHNVEALPWVDRVRVQRRWPNGLKVEVTEQIAAARWGKAGLLNTRGELFIRESRHIPPELPRLNGPEGSEWQVAQRYLSVQGQLLEVGTRLVALQLDPRGAWDLELANGIQVRLGRRDIEARLDRFVHTAWPVLTARATQVGYVDMRYSNGFAIGRVRCTAASAGTARAPVQGVPCMQGTGRDGPQG